MLHPNNGKEFNEEQVESAEENDEKVAVDNEAPSPIDVAGDWSTRDPPKYNWQSDSVISQNNGTTLRIDLKKV